MKKQNKAKINSVNIYSYIPYILLFLLLIPYHVKFGWFGDDVAYGESYTGIESLNTIGAYFSWGNRIFIWMATNFFSHYFSLWKIVDTFVCVLIPLMIGKILDNDMNIPEIHCLTCTLFIAYPFSDMASAGWAATTTGYLWSLCCMLYVLLNAKKVVSGDTLSIGEWILSVFAGIYGNNMELVVPILLSVYIYILAFDKIKKRKIQIYVIVQAAISVCSLVYIALCPGNSVRSAQEMANNFPNFAELSVVERFYLGVLNVTRVFISNYNILTLLLVLSLCILVWLSTHSISKTLISFVPVLIVFFYIVTPLYYGISDFFAASYYSPEKLYEVDLSLIDYWYPIFNFIFFSAGVIYSLYILFKENVQLMVLNILILVVGIGTGVIMGFSPTIYISDNRTLIFGYFAIIYTIASSYMYNRINDKNIKEVRLLIALSSIIAMTQYAVMISIV